MFPRMRLLFPQRNISLLYLKEKIVLSESKGKDSSVRQKKYPLGITNTFACLIAGSISSLYGNKIIKNSIQAAVPFRTDTALPHQ